MRCLTIAAAATLLLLPAAVPATACGAAMQTTKAVPTDYSAKKHQKMKKTANMKNEKVDYMRAVPMK